MTYKNIQKATFKTRPTRFIAEVEINDKTEICHVKNTGRCKELLIPGTTVYANYADNPKRATKYDLISVYKGNKLINIDSYAPNIAFGEYLRQGKFLKDITHVKAEAKYGNSRFDFYVETTTSKAFIEVKGVTLEENGIAMFPDAPTERGIKHLNELATCITEGYEAYAIFIIQMKGIEHFTPNHKIHAAFGETLIKAADMGVKVRAFDCLVKPGEILIDEPIEVKL